MAKAKRKYFVYQPKELLDIALILGFDTVIDYRFKLKVQHEDSTDESNEYWSTTENITSGQIDFQIPADTLIAGVYFVDVIYVADGVDNTQWKLTLIEDRK